MYDVILILGYLVDKKGKPAKEQVLRLNKGIWLFNKKEAKNIMMTGGFHSRFNKTDKSLAWHMRRFAIEKGVPTNKIITENKSTDTRKYYLFKVFN